MDENKIKLMIIYTIKQYKLFHVPKNQIYPFAFPLTPQHNNIFHIQHQTGKRLNFNKKNNNNNNNKL